MMEITKEYRFEAAHRLRFHPGQCRNIHGHSYRVEVAVPKGNMEGIAERFDGRKIDELRFPIDDKTPAGAATRRNLEHARDLTLADYRFRVSVQAHKMWGLR